jgi:hypothetical protein
LKPAASELEGKKTAGMQPQHFAQVFVHSWNLSFHSGMKTSRRLTAATSDSTFGIGPLRL